MRPLVLVIALACNGKPDPADDGGRDDADADTDTDTDSDVDTGGDGGNDSFADADPLVFEDGVAEADDAIETPGDRDFYAIPAVAGRTYVIHADGEGYAPDTVVRVYDPDEALLVEIDDLPYRALGADAGAEVYATRDGTLYVEVLDYSDWAGLEPDGNPTFLYELGVVEHETWEGVTEDNGADDDSAILAVGNLVDQDGDGYPEFPYGPMPFTGAYISEAHGTIDPAGDEDWLWTATLPSYGTLLCQFSTWPAVTALDPVFELWHEPCDLYSAGACTGADAERVASTDDADFAWQTGGLLYDVGIEYPMAVPGMYFLRVADADGSGGTDHWYSVLYTCYSLDAIAAPDVEDGFDEPELGQLLAEEPGYYDPTMGQAAFYGFLDGAPIGEDEDPSDTFLVDWLDSGEYLRVDVGTTVSGSLLDDVGVTVFHEDAPGDWSVLSTGPAPIVDLQSDGAPIAVSITSASGATGTDQYYFGVVTTSQTPLGP